MPSSRARMAAANAVRAFLADVAAVCLGTVYDIKTDSFSKKAWALTIKHFGDRCAYCHIPATSLPKGVKMTMEHLIEENQWQCGLHHPANVVPACSACNGSRDKAVDGSRLTWEQHLQNLGKAKKWNSTTIERRRKVIQDFVDNIGYPTIKPEEMEYLQKTARALYQDVLKRCTAGTRGFVEIHGARAVRIRPPQTQSSKKQSSTTVQNWPRS